MKLVARVGAALLWVAGICLPVSAVLSPNVAMAQDDGSDDSSSDDSSSGDESSGESASTESSTTEDDSGSSATRNWREADQGESGGD